MIKGLSLKGRIIIWFTIWMTVLISFVILLFISASDFLSRRSLEEDLAEAVAEAAEEPHDVDAYDDGVFLSVYSRSGNIISGRDLFPFYSYPVVTGSFWEARRDGVDYLVLDQMAHNFIIRGAVRLTTVSSLFSTSFWIILVILPVLVVLSALGGSVIVSRSTKSLYRMSDTAKQIADSEDLSMRMDEDGCHEPEIKGLAKSFNSMLDRLEEAFKRERQFTSDASHELRTPLSVIRAESEYALSALDDAKEVETSLEVIQKESVRMTDMLTQLLSLARFENGNVKLEIEKMDLSLTAEDVLSSLTYKAEDKQIALKGEIEEGISVEGDRTLLTRMLINIVDNSIRYTPEGGHVELELKRTDKEAVIKVMDDGIGISEKDLPHIFERFYQADSSHSGEGSGLGLSMVKSIVSVHKGTITCDSMEGKGTTFTVTLPISS